MECKINNDLGQITISEDVLLKVAGYAALECYGIVAMSSRRAKDGFVEWLGRENLSKGVQIRTAGDMLDVDLYIVVEYGISVSVVCELKNIGFECGLVDRSKLSVGEYVAISENEYRLSVEFNSCRYRLLVKVATVSRHILCIFNHNILRAGDRKREVRNIEYLTRVSLDYILDVERLEYGVHPAGSAVNHCCGLIVDNGVYLDFVGLKEDR